MKIAIIDYGFGNVASVRNMFSRLGVDACITSDPSTLRAADKLVLPGVGSYDPAIESLERLELIPLLNELVIDQRKPILGICLGMQLMTNASEEGKHKGLGWINASTKKIAPVDQGALKVPHMGWNAVKICKSSKLFNTSENEERFYFVHSYYVKCNEDSDILTTTDHGICFTSSFLKQNILGVQFHPEKSHKFGFRLLERFSKDFT